MASLSTFKLQMLFQETEALRVLLLSDQIPDELIPTLTGLSDKFQAVVKIIHAKIPEMLNPTEKTKEIQRKADKTLLKAFTIGEVNNRVLGNNLEIIFKGPPATDSTKSARYRSKRIKTVKRCAMLRELDRDQIIAWAISYPCAVWAGGTMGDQDFEYLTGHIKRKNSISWHTEVSRALQSFQTNFSNVEGFGDLLEGLTSNQPNQMSQDTAPSHSLQGLRLGGNLEAAIEAHGQINHEYHGAMLSPLSKWFAKDMISILANQPSTLRYNGNKTGAISLYYLRNDILEVTLDIQSQFFKGGVVENTDVFASRDNGLHNVWGFIHGIRVTHQLVIQAPGKDTWRIVPDLFEPPPIE